MTTVHTHLFTVEIPELFEKVIQMGPLIRAERMDRAPTEESFAELNFYVGTAAEEIPEIEKGASPQAIADGLWGRLLGQERQLGHVPEGAIHREPCGEGEIHAVLDLEPTPWRPASRQRVWIRSMTGSGGPFFARATLEYDAAFDDAYGESWRAILASFRWTKEPFTDADIEAQGQQVWSIFDSMEPDRLAQIRGRYDEIVGVLEPATVEAVEPTIVDLTALPPEEITLDFVQGALVVSGHGERAARLRCALFDGPIEFTVFEGDGEYQVGPGTVGIWRCLAKLDGDDWSRAGQLAWEHCRMCFEVTDYGAPEGQRNEEHFGIHGPEDAAAHLGQGTIYLAEHVPGDGHDVFAIDFYPPWEDEHGCSLVVGAGGFVAHGSPGDSVDGVGATPGE